MTSETPEQNDGTTPARRAPRRRATRAASAPQPAPAPIVVPATPEPAEQAPEPVVEPAAPAPAAAAATEPAGTTAEKPARRSRRATRSTTAATRPAEPAVAEPTEPAAAEQVEPTAAETTGPAAADQPDEAPAARATTRRSRATRKPAKEAAAAPEEPAEPTEEVAATAAEADGADAPSAPAVDLDLPVAAEPAATAASTLSLDDIVLPAGPGAPAAQGASRGRKRAAEPAPEQGAEAEAEAPQEQAAAPARRRRASRSTEAARKADAAAADARSTDTPASGASAQDAPAQDAPAADEKPSTRSTSRSPRGGARRAAAEPAPQPTGTPRLATTALLFQAPDLSTARSRRRAQGKAAEAAAADTATEAPSTTEAAVEAPATEQPATEQPAAEAGTRTTAGSTGRTGRSRRATRSTGRAEQAADRPSGAQDDSGAAPRAAADRASDAEQVEPGTTEAPVTEPIDLTEADEAAVGEVEEIESELVAEGLELVELGPEDFLDDGEETEIRPRRRRRRGGRGRRSGRRPEHDEVGDDEDDEDETSSAAADVADDDAAGEERTDAPEAEGDEQADAGSADEVDVDDEQSSSSRRRRRRRRGGRTTEREARTPRVDDEIAALKGSTRLEAKRQRRREGRDQGRRRQIITEAEFLARREAVNRSMIVREQGGRTQIAVLEDGVLVEHYVSQQAQASMVGNVYLGRVQNVLPSMEAAFVDVGKGRNAVLYAGEVNWDAAGVEGQPRRIEEALKSGDSVLVQVTKDPIGHKGARLTSQITLAGRYLVFVPGGGMTGISRKLPDTERSRLKKILRDVVPDGAGVIVRTAAEGASEDELRADVERLQSQWQAISAKADKSSTSAPALLQGEPDMAIRVVRDIFNDDFSSLVVQGENAWSEISSYVAELAPDLRERVTRFVENGDVFARHRIDEQLAKGMDRKVWLPSGGSLVIDRTEAMTVVDVNTGKFTGSGGTLEETVTRNNLEAAEEIVRQLRLRDIGGIIVIDFVDMVLESNRDLVLRRLVECLGRDRTKHQVAEVTSLGLVQMTRKRVGQGLVEAFSSTCEHCKGRGFIVHDDPIERGGAAHAPASEPEGASKRSRRKRGGRTEEQPHGEVPKLPEDESEARKAVKATLATIAAAAAHAHEHEHDHDGSGSAAPADEPAPAAAVDADTTAPDTAPEVGGSEPAVEPAAESATMEEPTPDVPADAEPVAAPEPAGKGAGDEGSPEPADDTDQALTATP
ncbi:ribonuclease E [Isoptericola jiangsuensis]|uniref:Ribonuclease E n=1 Tax=Isoptericola jiangsuensis TaxID=548579 RepID=A0A2A9EZX8_9MICO|nr:Rne/Rng family ribonuclease [Isoptericola jiangsuensis]PFG43709.1 ribonuclease E [Isoptericola jiangsuensis]